MSIWNRLLGVMVVLLALIGGLFLWQAHNAGDAAEKLLRATAAERQDNFSRVNRLISRSLEAFAIETSASSLNALPPSDAFARAAQEAQADIVAVIQPDVTVARLQETRGKLAPNTALPSANILASLVKQGERTLFFSPSPIGPIQFAFTPLAPAEGETQPSGYLLAGRYWDRLFLTKLGQAAEAEVQSIPVSLINDRPTGFTDNQQRYRFTDVGVGPLGQPVFAYTATFDLGQPLAIIRENRETQRRIAFGVLGVLVLFFAMLWKWLAYPVRLVAEALETDDPTVLKPILNEDYDWARIAQRLTESSEARLELTREVRRQQEQARIQEETARVRESLARDLHDGVIQSVYAVGLQLERANTLIERDPEKCHSRIDDCKNSLNGVISELRGFIKGLTPEPLRGQSMLDALEQLVIHSRKSTDASIDMQISPEACEALDTAQALNLYQLSRELLSNAIRHAQAHNIRLRLSHEGDAVLLRVSDDGIGFDPETVKSGGYGLGNLQERARQIGANVRVMSNTPNGSIVQVRVPINSLIS